VPTTYLPPGWPPEVRPPGDESFERTALNWLFDHCPPEFRAYDVLRRHPRLLARLAGEQLAASVEACRVGYRTARGELAAEVAPEVLAALMAAYEREGRRLAEASRGAELVARGLRGESFVRPL
jgi:hypothetical protein